MDDTNLPPSTPPPAIPPSPIAATNAGRTEPLAIASLVLSLLGIVCCGFILAIPGIICGHMALSKINRQPELGGRGMALAGTIIGYIVTIGSIIWLFFGGLAVVQGMLEQMNQ